MKARLSRRDFSDLAVQPDVTFTVVRYSHHAVGGPKSATIQASGKTEALFELVNHLREPIEIINEKGDCVWWGYLGSLIINTGTDSYGVDLDTMSNRVAVAYNIGLVRYTTSWANDDTSIDEYGYKELLIAKCDVIEADAIQTRDVHLSNTKYPVPVLRFARGKEAIATLTCRGWLDTLQWRYYKNDSGQVIHTERGAQFGLKIGTTNFRPKVAQSFKITSDAAWDATAIWLNVWYAGDVTPLVAPVDGLLVSLKDDNAGIPGATLASCTLPAADISEISEWLKFELNVPVTLNPATVYWIHVERTGALSSASYYVVDNNMDGSYEDGQLFFWFSKQAVWRLSTGNTPHDMLFMVVGEAETTDQIKTLITSTGQFIVGTIIEDESGLVTNPYRDGDTAGGYELEKLLEAGTTNDRRLLCEVTPLRYFRVYEEPVRPEKVIESYALDKSGQLLTSALTPIDMSLCPVGIWCHLHNVIPVSVDLMLITDPSLFFIEEAVYDVQTGQYRLLRTRDQGSVLDIGGVVPG